MGGQTGGADLEDRNLGQMPLQPAAALAVGVGMGINYFDIMDLAGPGNQIVRYFEVDFAADLQLGIDKLVQGFVDYALGGIFNGNDTQMVIALFSRT